MLTGFNVPPPRIAVPRVLILNVSHLVPAAGQQLHPAREACRVTLPLLPGLGATVRFHWAGQYSRRGAWNLLCARHGLGWTLIFELYICFLLKTKNKKIPNSHTFLSSLPCECSLITSPCSFLTQNHPSFPLLPQLLIPTSVLVCKQCKRSEFSEAGVSHSPYLLRSGHQRMDIKYELLTWPQFKKQQ